MPEAFHNILLRRKWQGATALDRQKEDISFHANNKPRD